MPDADHVRPAAGLGAPPARGDPDLDAEAKIAVALDLFRKEQITIYELRLMLGLKRDEANALLVSRKEFAQSPTLEDLENDARTHSELFKARQR